MSRTFLSIIGVFLASFQCVFGDVIPDTYVLNSRVLQNNKNEISAGNRVLVKAKSDLIKEAESILKRKHLYSVAFKTQVPKGGSKNDYYSLARYYWSSSSNNKTVAYISRDGKVNPEINEIEDHDMLANVSNDIYTLGLAYYFSGDERYVSWINSLMNTFFIDKNTKMNPNLKYAQIIKGRGGNANVIIGANSFVMLIEGLKLVQDSKSLNANYYNGVKSWFGVFLDWILGQKSLDNERYANNNTGIYFTVQTTVYSLFTGRTSFAKKFLEDQSRSIVNSQIAKDGSLPNELKRAKPWSYVSYALLGLDQLIELSNKLSVPIYRFQSSTGTNIQSVYKWLIPYAKKQKKWNFSSEAVSANIISKVLMRSVSYSSNNTVLPVIGNPKYTELLTSEIIRAL